jgi:hypothetical protein
VEIGVTNQTTVKEVGQMRELHQETETTIELREDERSRRTAHRHQWRRWDHLDALWWAMVFVWGALVLIADTTSFSDDLDWWDGSGVFWIGAGLLALIGIPLRLGMTRYHSRIGSALFWGTVFLSVGLGQLAGRPWYALSLVAIAGLILSATFHGTGRKERSSPADPLHRTPAEHEERKTTMSKLRDEIRSYEADNETEVKCFGVMRCLKCPMSAVNCPFARHWMREGSTTS